MKVYVVMLNDGNVCCPATDIDKIFLNWNEAAAYALDMKNKDDEDRWVDTYDAA